jgi:hypothetical protein
MSTGVAETYDARIAALQVEIADLRRSVRRLERQQRAGGQSYAAAEDLSMPACESGMDQALDCVRQFTKAMFPGEVSIEAMADPERPEERFVVFNVTAAGEVQELLRRQRQWHEEVLRRAPDAFNLFRISITPA